MLSPSWKNRNVSMTSYSKSCTRMWCGSRLWRRSSIAIVTVWTRRASPLEKERRLLRDRGPSKKWRTWKRERPRCCTMYMFRFFYHSGFLFRFFFAFRFYEMLFSHLARCNRGLSLCFLLFYHRSKCLWSSSRSIKTKSLRRKSKSKSYCTNSIRWKSLKQRTSNWRRAPCDILCPKVIAIVFVTASRINLFS